MMKKKLAALAAAGMMAAIALTGCASGVSAKESTTQTTADTSGSTEAGGNITAAGDNAGAGGSLDGVQTAKTVTVNGTGTVSVSPDVAQISLGIQTVDTSTKDAQAANTKTVNKVIEALEKAGVEEKNITTSGLDIYANYDYSGSGSGNLTGYTVTTTLQLNNLPVDDVGSLIDVATDAGVNQVNGISYSYSDSVTAYDEAMEAALDRAQEKAQKIADKEGKSLGGIKTIQESSSSYDTPVDSMAAKQEASADGAMQVLSGETDVSATVTVTYYFN